jgi:hypothetical protein
LSFYLLKLQGLWLYIVTAKADAVDSLLSCAFRVVRSFESIQPTHVGCCNVNTMFDSSFVCILRVRKMNSVYKTEINVYNRKTSSVTSSVF